MGGKRAASNGRSMRGRPRVLHGALTGGLLSLVLLLLVVPVVFARADISAEVSARLIIVATVSAPLLGGAVGAWRAGGSSQHHRQRLAAGVAGPLTVALVLIVIGAARGGAPVTLAAVGANLLLNAAVAGMAALVVSWRVARR